HGTSSSLAFGELPTSRIPNLSFTRKTNSGRCASRQSLKRMSKTTIYASLWIATPEPHLCGKLLRMCLSRIWSYIAGAASSKRCAKRHKRHQSSQENEVIPDRKLRPELNVYRDEGRENNRAKDPRQPCPRR